MPNLPSSSGPIISSDKNDMKGPQIHSGCVVLLIAAMICATIILVTFLQEVM